MASTLRLGVVGLGSIGRIHVKSFRTVPGVEVAAVAEIDQKRADALGEEYNIPLRYGDYRKMLKEAELDAITVCVPNYLHCPVAVAGLKAGCHVMVEKPPAMSVKEVKLMAATAKEVGKTMMVAFCFRFRAETQKAKNLIEQGSLGEVYHARVTATRRRGIPGLGGWFTSKKQGGGGPLLDIGVHVMDTALYLMGYPEATHACGQTYRKFGHRDDYSYTGMWGTRVPGGPFQVEDLCSAFVRFKNGTTMTVEASWAAELKPELKVEIMGDKGGVLLVPGEKPPLTVFTQHGDTVVDEIPMLKDVDGYAAEAAHFVDCIRTKKRPMSHIETGLHVQRVIDGIYKSAKAGKEVKL